MARVTYVKKAQQRYATKPVLDAEGNPTYTTRTLSRPTKRGKTETTARVTERDLTKPLPNYKCDKCGEEILPGQPYKWIKPKSGPYGGHMRTRCGSCPSWNVWDYSYSLSAQVARIEHDATNAVAGAEPEEDVTSALSDAAEAIRELAEQKRESASNIEEGFGHATYQSEELEQTADDLDGWADEVESADVPDQDDYQDESEVDCDECQGTGQVDNEDYDEDDDDSEAEVDCDVCAGSGQVVPEDPEVDLDEWRSAVAEAVSEALGNCPV